MHYRLLILMVCVLAAGGCAGSTQRQVVTIEERDWALRGAPLPGEVVPELAIPDEPVLTLTLEMQRFAEAAVAGATSKRERLRALVGAVIQPDKLGLRYDAQATYTAQDTFKNRRAGCLSFTSLIVAFGRHVGLNIYFNEVDVPPVWDMQDPNTLVLYKHVNAIAELPQGQTVVDFAMEEYDTSYAQREISDQLAMAQYYNNRAMEYLYTGAHGDAFRYLRKAIALEPEVSYFWSNLGGLYRRLDNRRAAEIAYRVAMQITPDDFVAISNAARLYEELGQLELAARLKARAEFHRQRNPYFQYKQALDAYLMHDYAEATRRLDTAINLYPKEHRFYFLQGAIFQLSGDSASAEKSLSRALELSTDEEQMARYRRKMDLLKSARS